MGIGLKNILKKSFLNQWQLFFGISIFMSIFMVIEMLQVDLTQPQNVSHMIGYSVRWSIPFICLVLMASSFHALFPGEFSKWLLRNRKQIGLCFAAAMAWQGLFIFMISSLYRDYYFEEIYYFRDELEGSTGYIFLAAMVITSFKFGRKNLNANQWKLLHRCGVYFLWAYPFSVYWWNLYYYKNPELIDHVFYWICFLAFAIRIVAWGKKRHRAISSPRPHGSFTLPIKFTGAIITMFGLVAAATGLQWQEKVTTFFTSTPFTAELELWLPFWPFEPFYPLLILGIGTWLLTSTLPQNKPDSLLA